MPARGHGLNDRFTVSHKDAFGDVRSALSGSAQWATEAFNSTGFILNWLRHDQNDYFQMTLQFNHDRKLTSAVDSIHIHYIPGANVGGDVYLQYYYTWVPFSSAIPAIGAWTTGFSTITVPNAALWNHKISAVVSNIAAPGGDSYGSIMLIHITRLGTDLSDTFNTNRADAGAGVTSAANFGVLYLDAHYVADKVGSDNEITDN